MFPCYYPIKVIGSLQNASASDFSNFVYTIVKQYMPDLQTTDLTSRASNKGNYQSITVNFYATSEPQLKKLNNALKAKPEIIMVL